MPTNIKYAFFGTDEFAVTILDTLTKEDYPPTLLVTATDKPAGRKMILTPPKVKIWAEKNNIPTIQPEKLSKEYLTQNFANLLDDNFDLFIVASYGKIIPQYLLNIPKHQTLNIHPSLLPKYRGATPIQSALLNSETKTGVTIMILDAEMDHGPILAQEDYIIEPKDNYPILRDELALRGAELLLTTLADWLAGKINPSPQNHQEATFTQKITKEMGQIQLSDKPEEIYSKFKALTPWPGIYFFLEKENKKIRIKITDLEILDGKLIIKKIIPEGKKEMDFENFKINF